MEQPFSGSFKPLKSEYVLEVVKELLRWPSDLQYICRPKTIEEQKQYAENIINWGKKSYKRREAFSLWQKYKKHFSLSARKWPLNKIITMVKILLVKKAKNDRWKSRSNFNDSDEEYE